jgi:mono/diheme cytochrome c family protein
MNKNTIAISFATIFTIGVAIFTYSQNVNSDGVADPTDVTQVAQGKSIYSKACASCHGKNLEGETSDWKSIKDDGTLPAPPHNDEGHSWHHDDGLLFKYTKEGGQSIGGPDFQSGMPAFSEKLSDAEIWSVLAFIKTSWSEQHLRRQTMMTERMKKE